MNFKFETNEYKIKECKKNISFYKKELKRIKEVNMTSTAYKTDNGFKYLTDKHCAEFSEILENYKNRLIELKRSCLI